MFLLSLPKDILFLSRNGISPSESDAMPHIDYELTLKKAEDSEQNKTRHISNTVNSGSGFKEFLNAADPVAAILNSAAANARK